MRIGLVIPPSNFLTDERVFCSLGVLKVAAALEQVGHKVSVLDLSGVKDYARAAHDYAMMNPDIERYGITATTPQMPAALAIRYMFHHDTVILGGPHVTLVHAAYRNEQKRGVVNGRAAKALEVLQESFGVLVTGDGEQAIHYALNAKRGQIVDADDPKSDMFLTHIGFTNSPWPARHLIDLPSYRYEIDGRKATSIVGQLGCPFGCNFCGGRLSPMLRRARLRDADNIIAEMRHVYEVYRYTGFMFYDDELNVNPKLIDLLKGITALQEDLGVEFRLRGFVKAELFTEEQAQWMYRAGFRWLLCGFESGSPRILRNIQKKATREDNTRMLTTARQAGIKVKGLMSLGHPGESAETIADTKDWLLSERPDDFDATVITVYPGTPYFDMATQCPDGSWVFDFEGDKLYHHDLDFTKELAFYKGNPGEYKSFVWTDYISSDDLVRQRDALEESVRRQLNIPYPYMTQALIEQSMGMTKI